MNGGKTTTTYEVRNATGRLVAIHLRTDTGEDKKMWWETPDGRKNLNGTPSSALPLYNAQLVGDWGEDDLVVLTEGEKAAQALLDAGLGAVGTVTGASGTPGAEALEVLRGRRIVVWSDNDDAGRAHMARVAEALQGVAAEVRFYTWHEAPDKGDAADHLAVTSRDPRAVDRLLTDLESAPLWSPAKKLDKASKLPEILTAADLLAESFPPERWAVPGILPEGVTLLAGKPKTGKSWLALGLCVATTTGGVAFGTKPVEKGSCLYLALEDNYRRLQKRLKKLLAGGPAPLGLHIATSWPPLDKGGLEKLQDYLIEHPDTRMVVVDVLKKVRPRIAGNRSMYDADYEALEGLVKLAAERGVTIVVVHHLRKLQADDPLDEISGSTGLSGCVDGMLVLKRDRGRAEAYLHVTGRDIEEDKELALEWSPDTAGWYIAGDAADHRMSKERKAIMRVLKEAGEPMTPTEVADVLGNKNANAIKQRLWRMANDGQVISRNGRYEITHNRDNPITDEVGSGYRVMEVTGYSRGAETENGAPAASVGGSTANSPVWSEYDPTLEESLADTETVLADDWRSHATNCGCVECA